MGLQLVEILYAIEAEFEIIIPNEVSEKLNTARMTIDYLMSLPKVNEKWSKEYVEISVWMIIENEGGINREDFNDDSRFVEDMGLN